MAPAARLLLALMTVALAAGAPAPAAGGEALKAEEAGPGAWRVSGGFTTAAPADIVWRTLTDYDHLRDFVPSLRESAVEKRGPGYAMVRQTASARAFIFKKTVTVLLLVREEPPSRIAFQDLCRQNFRFYEGAWTIGRAPDGRVTVGYELLARPSFSAPGFAVRRVLLRNAQSLLDDVKREMERRDPRSGNSPAIPRSAGGSH